MSLLTVTGLSHTFGDKVLYQNASFSLHPGEHMGITGQNGAGKSTLIRILTGALPPDHGLIQWQPGLSLGYLDQHAVRDTALTVRDCLRSAYAPLCLLERETQGLYDAYAASGEDKLLRRAALLQERLELSGFYDLEVRVDKVAAGLGLTAMGLNTPLSRLSGGQRAKVILAKLLLEEPDILLLDEPTNFLDREHVEWLAGYLAAFPGAFLTVSHDSAFLGRISSCILDVSEEGVRKYHGSFADYLRQKAFQREDLLRRYAAQQKQIRQTEDFIRKNIAGNNSKNAKGRRKQLDRLERISAPAGPPRRPAFHFVPAPVNAQKLLSVQGLVVGYDRPLLPGLDLTLTAGEVLVVNGFNGIGKSTLIKTLAGELPPLAGSFSFAQCVKMGYDQQELSWSRPDASPLELLSAHCPGLTQRQLRARLAACGVDADSIRQPVTTLSGGEQAKVKLCRLLLSPCNVLLLDEPTNHLDRAAKEALGQALSDFPGAVLLVCHEAGFYRGLTHRVLHITQSDPGAPRLRA